MTPLLTAEAFIRPDASQMNDSVRLNWCGAVEGASLPSSSRLSSFQPWPFAFPWPLTFNCLRSVFPFPLSRVQTWQSVAVGCRGGFRANCGWGVSRTACCFDVSLDRSARERDWAQCRNHHGGRAEVSLVKRFSMQGSNVFEIKTWVFVGNLLRSNMEQNPPCHSSLGLDKLFDWCTTLGYEIWQRGRSSCRWIECFGDPPHRRKKTSWDI